MNDRKQRIDEFLKYLRDIVLQNPDYDLSEKTIYSELTRLGVPKNQRDILIDNYFSKWCHYFENNSKCDVFVSLNWSYFCQFISSDGLASAADEHIKLYVPLDNDHIEQGAIKIFEFLSKKGIIHVSKIGSHIRFDNIVIRLIHPEDVSVLMDFLNSDEYIQQGLIPANPFTFNLNGIPMAVDGHLSYNDTIAHFIKFYIDEKKKTTSLNTVNAEDFYDYIKKYYDKVFSNAEGLEQLRKNFSIFSSEEIVNYKNVINLIIKSSDDNFTYEDYINHYNECNDSRIQIQKKAQIEDIKKGEIPRKIIIPELKELTGEQIKNTNEKLIYLVNTMCEKYSNQHLVLQIIEKYVKTGDLNYIINYKNLRQDFASSTFTDDVYQLLKGKQISFMFYARKVLDNRREILKDKLGEIESYNEIEKSVFLTAMEIFSIMTKKSNEKIAKDNLLRYIVTGNLTSLIGAEDLQDFVANSSFLVDLNEMLEKRNLMVQDFLILVELQTILSKEKIFESSILETYNKYEEKFNEGSSDVSGFQIVKAAISNFLLQRDPTGFTRDNDARQKIIDNITVGDCIMIIKNFANINDLAFSNEQLSFILDNYLDVIIKNNKQSKVL